MMIESVVEVGRYEFCFVPNVREKYYRVLLGFKERKYAS